MPNNLNHSAFPVARVQDSRENPFTRQVFDGASVEQVPDDHPISRDLKADSFNLTSLSEAGINKKSTKPFLLPSLEQRVAGLEKLLSDKAASVASSSVPGSDGLSSSSESNVNDVKPEISI